MTPIIVLIIFSMITVFAVKYNYETMAVIFGFVALMHGCEMTGRSFDRPVQVEIINHE